MSVVIVARRGGVGCWPLQWLLMGRVVSGLTPGMGEVFADFDVELPRTVVLLERIPAWAWWVVVGVVIVALLVKEVCLSDRVQRVALSCAASVIGWVLLVLWYCEWISGFGVLVEGVSG